MLNDKNKSWEKDWEYVKEEKKKKKERENKKKKKCMVRNY